MATAPVSRRLNLTRDQLAQFLTDQQQIRQFELLFSVVDELQVITGTDFEYQADTAAATANDALGRIAALAQEVAVSDSVTDVKATQALDQIAMLAQETAVSIASAENKANQALAMLGQLATAVEGLQMTPPPREFKRSRYGSFYDSTTQTAAVINTAYGITFDTTDLSNGVYVGSPTSRIYVDESSLYDIQFSAQFDNTSGGDHLAWLWLRKNGTDVADSAGEIRLKGNNGELVASWNYFIELVAGDYVEIMWSTDNTAVQITARPAVAPVPAIPSIILTVSNNIKGVQ
jgi:hypothetical protein